MFFWMASNVVGKSEEVVGTRFKKKICRTQAEWLALQQDGRKDEGRDQRDEGEHEEIEGDGTRTGRHRLSRHSSLGGGDFSQSMPQVKRKAGASPQG